MSRRHQILFWVAASIVIVAILYAAMTLMLISFGGPNYGIQDPSPRIR